MKTNVNQARITLIHAIRVERDGAINLEPHSFPLWKCLSTCIYHHAYDWSFIPTVWKPIVSKPTIYLSDSDFRAVDNAITQHHASVPPFICPWPAPVTQGQTTCQRERKLRWNSTMLFWNLHETRQGFTNFHFILLFFLYFYSIRLSDLREGEGISLAWWRPSVCCHHAEGIIQKRLARVRAVRFLSDDIQTDVDRNTWHDSSSQRLHTVSPPAFNHPHAIRRPDRYVWTKLSWDRKQSRPLFPWHHPDMPHHWSMGT